MHGTIQQSHDIPEFIFLSHHPKDKKSSPCASVYQALIGPDRVADLAGYCNVETEPAAFIKQLNSETAKAQAPHFLFNGFQSLLLKSSIVALEFAMSRGIPVTIYWHETAWNLRFLAQREKVNFQKARALLQCLDVTNWVPTSQCLHSVATMFGFPLDTFRIVYEVVDLSAFQVTASTSQKSADDVIVIAGAGVPDERKGIDIFSYIAHTVKASTERPVEFRWYAATPTRQSNPNVPYPKAVRWMGHQNDFQAALKDVDIFVLTSRDDPSPLVVFEALATGHASYAFATTGFNEMLPPDFVALDPDDMCRMLLKKIDSYEPNPSYYRSIAENFSVERFRDRAFRVRHAYQFNLPILDEEIVDSYSEEDAELLDRKIERLEQQRAGLLRVMRNVHRDRVNMDAKGRRLDYVIKERDELKAMTRRLASSLKIEAFRDDRRQARASRPKGLVPWVSKPTNLKVLVLGNAPSVLNRDLGPKIDTFDVVIRVNNFRIKGFEKHVGTKTTYALISPACMPSEELSKLSPGSVFVLGANLRDDYQKIKTRLTDQKRGCHVVPPPSNVLNSALYVDAMKIEMDFDLSQTQWPSTGIVAVQWAKDRHGKAADVFVHGFDFYSDNRSTLTRYFNVTTKPDGKHDFDREKEYMMRLLDRGLIKKL